MTLALALTACGGSSSAATRHDEKSTAIPVCYPAATAAMASFLGIQAQQISTAKSTGTTGNPECSYTTGTGRRKIKLVADDYMGPQPYFILERTAIEAVAGVRPQPHGAARRRRSTWGSRPTGSPPASS